MCRCLSVCHAPSNCFFFFVSRWNRAIFWLSVLHLALYKMLFLDFWFRPPNAQNLLPKICTKSPVIWLVCQIDQRCLGLLGGFRGLPIQWNHAKCCGADPCCHGNEIWQGAEIQSPSGLLFWIVCMRYFTNVPTCTVVHTQPVKQPFTRFYFG